jgi:hypothetical protein
MILVRDLFDVIYDWRKREFPIVAQFGNHRFYLSRAEVVDDILYLVNTDSIMYNVDAWGLWSYIRDEARNECWQPADPRNASKFMECEVVVSDGEYDSPEGALYSISGIEVSHNEVVLQLCCKEGKPEAESQWSITLNSSTGTISEKVQGTPTAVENYLVKKINEYMHIGDPDATDVTVADLNGDYLGGGFGVMIKNYDGKDSFVEVYACEVEPEEIIHLDNDGNPIESKEVA